MASTETNLKNAASAASLAISLTSLLPVLWKGGVWLVNKVKGSAS